MDYTALYVTIDLGEIRVDFPTDYLTEKVPKMFGMSLSEFMENYDSDMVDDLMERALIDLVKIYF